MRQLKLSGWFSDWVTLKGFNQTPAVSQVVDGRKAP